MKIEPLDYDLFVGTPIGFDTVTHKVCKCCIIKIENRELSTKLVVLDMHDFDVILGIDWLAKYYASWDCQGKKIDFRISSEQEFSFMNSFVRSPPRIISCLHAKTLINNGCIDYLAIVRNVQFGELQIDDIPIVKEFPNIFLDDLPSLP